MQEHKCPNCGGILSDPERPCPVCLLRYAAEDTLSSETGTVRPNIPEISRVQEAFPELEIMEKIGSGGMGTVFKAFQAKLDRHIALKILYSELAEKPAFAERFAREGKLLARLSHPNIVTIYDFGKTTLEDGTVFFYLIMEYVEGVNLRQAMREEKFSPEQAFSIVPKICDALQYAHDEGVLHRDIKPENILLDTRGRIKIADFGIGKLHRGEGEPTAFESGDEKSEENVELRTNAGSVLGTLRYMAPEQFQSPDKVDHRADIYSLGVVFYELLTGELPRKPIELPSGKTAVDKEVDDIVLKAMEKERTRRFQSASEMKTKIETAATHLGEISPVSPARIVQTPYKPPYGPIAALILVVLAVIGLFIVQMQDYHFFDEYWEMKANISSVISLNLKIDTLLEKEKNIRDSSEDATEREFTALKYERFNEWHTELENRKNVLIEQKQNWTNEHDGKAKLLFLWTPLGLALLMTACSVYGFLYLRKLRPGTEKPGIIPTVFTISGFMCIVPPALFFCCIKCKLNFESEHFAISLMSIAFLVSIILYLAFVPLFVRFLLLATRDPEHGNVHYSRAYAALGTVLAGITVPFIAAIMIFNFGQSERHIFQIHDAVNERAFKTEYIKKFEVITVEINEKIREEIRIGDRKIPELDAKYKELFEQIAPLNEEIRTLSSKVLDPSHDRTINSYKKKIEPLETELKRIENEKQLINDREKTFAKVENSIRDDYYDMRDSFRYSSFGYDVTYPSIALNIITILFFTIFCTVIGIVFAGDYLFRHRKVKELRGRIPAIIIVSVIPAGAFIFGIIVFIAWLSSLNGQTAIAVSIGILTVVVLILGTLALIALFRNKSR